MIDTILTWMKDFLIIYLILTILTNLAAADSYKKYLHFFSGMILLLVLVAPIFNLFGEAGRLEAMISYEAFWEGLDSARQDTQKLEFPQSGYYIRKYEQAIAQEMERQAAARGLPVSGVSVVLSEDYEIKQAVVRLDALPESSLAAAREEVQAFFAKNYQLKQGQILVQ